MIDERQEFARRRPPAAGGIERRPSTATAMTESRARPQRELGPLRRAVLTAASGTAVLSAVAVWAVAEITLGRRPVRAVAPRAVFLVRRMATFDREVPPRAPWGRAQPPALPSPERASRAERASGAERTPADETTAETEPAVAIERAAAGRDPEPEMTMWGIPTPEVLGKGRHGGCDGSDAAECKEGEHGGRMRKAWHRKQRGRDDRSEEKDKGPGLSERTKTAFAHAGSQLKKPAAGATIAAAAAAGGVAFLGFAETIMVFVAGYGAYRVLARRRSADQDQP